MGCLDHKKHPQICELRQQTWEFTHGQLQYYCSEKMVVDIAVKENKTFKFKGVPHC